jgi:hypothetical protein
MITVFATLYTVSGRIRNENKEKHKPYLILSKINQLDKIDEYKYYLTMIGRNYQEKEGLITLKKIENLKKDNYLAVSLIINNIGYGVASNIKFYDLLSGNSIYGTQSSIKEKNQKLFTTLDLAINAETQVQSKVISILNTNDQIEEIDHCRILCVYQDLNGNIYDFIISINVKTGNSYDFFAYQRTSHSYAKWIKENKKQYKKIVKQYKK